nr:phosphoribosylanthranilate isomerase [Thermoleophilaceae bacterium]
GAKVMKAARVKDAASVRELRAYRRVDLHMLDAYTADKLGGTGKAFDWSLAEGHAGPPLVLSGGLTPVNVEAGIRALHPFAVDTASGTDSEPGVKDEAKVRDFFEAVERARPEEPAEPAEPKEEAADEVEA